MSSTSPAWLRVCFQHEAKETKGPFDEPEKLDYFLKRLRMVRTHPMNP